LANLGRGQPPEPEIYSCVVLARGLSNKEIGERLVISPKTVGNHVEHIYVKIDANTRTGASLFAMKHGLLPDADAGTEYLQFSPAKEMAEVEQQIMKNMRAMQGAPRS
jgi:hypothetical protein